jgi:hypothetical protein
MSTRKPRNAEKQPPRKRLQLSKETLKDLADDNSRTGQVKGAGGGGTGRGCDSVG